MEKKVINRNIGESTNLRLKYGDCHDFHILEININFKGKLYTFEVEALHLSTETDSIHVKPIIENGKIRFRWTGWVAPYVRNVF